MIGVKFTSGILSNSIGHRVEFTRAPDPTSTATDIPVCIATKAGLQGASDSAPTAASLATMLMLEMEHDMRELRKTLARLGLLDDAVLRANGQNP